jgi:hypothetical protein
VRSTVANPEAIEEELKAMEREEVEKLAYRLWEEAEHPHSDGVEFWLKAEEMLKIPPKVELKPSQEE